MESVIINISIIVSKIAINYFTFEYNSKLFDTNRIDVSL